jgi:hypothetical protein
MNSAHIVKLMCAAGIETRIFPGGAFVTPWLLHTRQMVDGSGKTVLRFQHLSQIQYWQSAIGQGTPGDKSKSQQNRFTPPTAMSADIWGTVSVTEPSRGCHSYINSIMTKM